MKLFLLAPIVAAATLLLMNGLVLICSAVFASTLRAGLIAAIVGAVFAAIGVVWSWMLLALLALTQALRTSGSEPSRIWRPVRSLSAALTVLSCVAVLFALATLSGITLRLASGISVFD